MGEIAAAAADVAIIVVGVGYVACGRGPEMLATIALLIFLSIIIMPSIRDFHEPSSLNIRALAESIVEPLPPGMLLQCIKDVGKNQSVDVVCPEKIQMFKVRDFLCNGTSR